MIYSFLYVLVFSTALILIQALDLTIPPLFSLLITASIATFYFNLINIKHLKQIYAECLHNKKQWFVLMVIVLVMWATTMTGPGKIGASFFNFIYFAWLGTLGSLSLSFKNWEKNQIQFRFALGLCILIFINIFLELRSLFSFDAMYGILMALIGGTASFIYFKQSQVLTKTAHLSATQILAVRFYFSIIVIFSFLPTNTLPSYLTIFNTTKLILLAFLSLIIPLYFSQKALEKITPEQHAIINSLCPTVTGILQIIVFNDIKVEQMVIYFLYTLMIACLYWLTKNNKILEAA